jgi:uncharacterized BrkB/YihY/UPF0761 family membrane protein
VGRADDEAIGDDFHLRQDTSAAREAAGADAMRAFLLKFRRRIGKTFSTEYTLWEDRIMLIAAGSTVYLLLALFPTSTAFVSLYGFPADRAAGNTSMLVGILPMGGSAIPA